MNHPEIPEDCPERIYQWMDSQLSIARYYGAIKFRGHRYVIARTEPGNPLVRQDVIDREAKARKAAEKERRAQKASETGPVTGDLWGEDA